ncbi:hypothetical protein BC834DRAFT_788728, partial [Gloeopeniophorella convolvens]
NAWFDASVMSRQHAEVWAEARKVYIRDTRSVNGTYVNGRRLSAAGDESDPVELKSDDVVEFGCDVKEDETVHSKVAARVNVSNVGLE